MPPQLAAQPRHMLNRPSLLLLALLALACRTTYQSSPANTDELDVRVGHLVASWRVMEGQRLVGWLRRYEGDGAQGSTLFVVQNEYQQDLGIVDSHGRAWRSKPHQEQKRWLTTDTVLEGTRQILGLSQPPRLEKQLEAADAGPSNGENGEVDTEKPSQGGL